MFVVGYWVVAGLVMGVAFEGWSSDYVSDSDAVLGKTFVSGVFWPFTVLVLVGRAVRRAMRPKESRVPHE